MKQKVVSKNSIDGRAALYQIPPALKEVAVVISIRCSTSDAPPTSVKSSCACGVLKSVTVNPTVSAEAEPAARTRAAHVVKPTYRVEN